MDIRIFSKLAAAVAMLLTIASCNKTEMANTGAAVGYSVGIAGADGSKATAGTKAVLFNSATDIQQNGNSFACSAYNETKKTSLYTGETVTYNGTKWDTTNPYNWQPGETLTFHAVYPATAAGTDDGKAVIAADGTGISISNYTVANDAANQNDILLGKYSGAGKTTGKPDGTAFISFQHPFTAVRFVMGDIADYIPGFSGITSITISNVYAGGSLAKWNGDTFAWTPVTDTKTVTMTVGGTKPDKTKAIEGTDANAKAFTLIPQALSTKPATITINYNATVNGSIVATVSKVSETGTAWEAGNVYTYTVNYKTLPVTINDSVEPWVPDAKDVIDADDVPAPKVEFVEIGGLKWAKCNLGAEKETDYGYHFFWAGTEGYVYDKTNSKWVTASDGSELLGGFIEANAPYNNGSSSYSKYNYSDSKTVLDLKDDAANVALGETWRMPTTAEFKNLSDACGGGFDRSKNPGKDTVVGKGIYWCTDYDGVAGCLFCDGTNKLFLPVTGFGNNAFRNADAGYYWTKTRSTGFPHNAYHWSLNGGGFTQEFNSRQFGYSIRPVSE